MKMIVFLLSALASLGIISDVLYELIIKIFESGYISLSIGERFMLGAAMLCIALATTENKKPGVI